MNTTELRERPSRHHLNIAFDVTALAASPGAPLNDFAFALRTPAEALGG